MISIKGCNLLLGVISLFGKTETSNYSNIETRLIIQITIN